MVEKTIGAEIISAAGSTSRMKGTTCSNLLEWSAAVDKRADRYMWCYMSLRDQLFITCLEGIRACLVHNGRHVVQDKFYGLLNVHTSVIITGTGISIEGLEIDYGHFDAVRASESFNQ